MLRYRLRKYGYVLSLVNEPSSKMSTRKDNASGKDTDTDPVVAKGIAKKELLRQRVRTVIEEILRTLVRLSIFGCEICSACIFFFSRLRIGDDTNRFTGRREKIFILLSFKENNSEQRHDSGMREIPI